MTCSEKIVTWAYKYNEFPLKFLLNNKIVGRRHNSDQGWSLLWVSNLSLIHTTGLILKSWDWTETNKPHGWASKLACAFRLRACVGIKTEHHHWSVLHRQPFMTEVTLTLPSQPLLSRSLSRVCRAKIEQRVIGHWSHHDGLDYLSPVQKKQFFSRQSLRVS